MATLQGNKHKEGVHLVVPPEFANFFIASASAGAALVGLLFVAVSIAPEQLVTRRAPVERQAVAGSAFTALMNAFFIEERGRSQTLPVDRWMCSAPASAAQVKRWSRCCSVILL